ncbi:YdcF family protein [Microbulbifer variabilis]|uniref:YdcF family protein n=1 Tax=Microbulbifer variabilis TaxID=266805 RepID=UPI001CFE0614|nr:YdcF family protein [Microbulbifer variabilis]
MIELYKIAINVLMPPLAPMLGLLVAFCIRFFPEGSLLEKSSLPLAVFSFCLLWLSATPAFSSWLGKCLGSVTDLPNTATAPKALVVLGGGVSRDGESGYETLSTSSLERVLWAAQHGPKDLPILVSGGRVSPDEHASESQLMADLLDELSLPVSWRDVCSHTTAENAVNSAEILRGAGVDTIVLATHWWHMPRAAAVFKRAGLKVQPLPVGSISELLPRAQGRVLHWIPSAEALLKTQTYWRELVAQVWYQFRPLPQAKKC